MNSETVNKHEKGRSERWIDGITQLAEQRGDDGSVVRRAVSLCRELNLAPWIALAVAERLITLKEARIVDRASRCRELQEAVLEKRLPLADLMQRLPYAAHFLAADLMDHVRQPEWDVRRVTAILERVLGSERKFGGAEVSVKVRHRSVGEYAEVVRRILGIMERTHCDVAMGVDVELGRLTEDYVTGYVRQKRRLEREEREAMEPLMSYRLENNRPYSR
jgi:hypothetical protein